MEKNGNSRPVVMVLGSLLALGLCALVASLWLLQPVAAAVQFMQELADNSQAAEVDQVARGIVDFQLPPGYTGQYALSSGDLELAMYAPSTYNAYLVLMQLPPGASEEQAAMERQLREQARIASHAQLTNVRTISSGPVPIRVQSATVTIGEGTNSPGETCRLVYATFQGKDGPAFLMIAAPLSHWSPAEEDAIIASLR